MAIDIRIGDCMGVLPKLPEKSVNCCVTSPPYWGLRDYGHDDQIGLEKNPEEYVAKLVEVFSQVRRVMRDDGTLWLNLGDSYATGAGAVGRRPGGGEQGDRFLRSGHINTQPNRMPLSGFKPKDLVGIPWMVAFALRADGWYLRQEIIWQKPNPMPESVRDRCTKAHEQIFLLSKSPRYYWDYEAMQEPATYSGPNAPDAIKSPHGQGFTRRARERVPSGWDTGPGNHRKKTGRYRNSGNKARKPASARGCPTNNKGKTRGDVRGSVPWEGSTRNKRSVWAVPTKPFSDAHFATFPPELIEPCILAGCPEGGTVLDPFGGAGTTGLVCDRNHRHAILIELNADYGEISRERIRSDAPLFSDVNVETHRSDAFDDG